ncbi:hypothetical protein SAMN04488007_1886 [Maribacter aquivivus]|uniref:Uncharacterized protein n=1 Tax=Maribacter aquivivus TaxID=228958 RepID=A0A1M6N3K2_9FLAO|nr:hypothetical protein [Maribacter aquivivus]SHJ90279.1 hypothetical protein SAMN04488007_1886 [Maribacter aquivivus]
MEFNGLLPKLPKPVRLFLVAFVIVLSVGYFTGLLFVSETSTASVDGIEENYLGNESDENADVMKFKKSKRQMLTIIHTHILSMSFIFFLLGILVWLTKLPTKLKVFLTVEPFLSVLLTFGGIYFIWSGVTWFKYLVIVSGILMTATYTASAMIVLYQLTFSKQYGNTFNQ